MGCSSSKDSGTVNSSPPEKEVHSKNRVTFAEQTIEFSDHRQSSTNSLETDNNESSQEPPVDARVVSQLSTICEAPDSIKSEISHIVAETDREFETTTVADNIPVPPPETEISLDFDSGKTSDVSPSTKAALAQQNEFKKAPETNQSYGNSAQQASLPEVIPPPPPSLVKQTSAIISPTVPDVKKGYILKQGHIVKNWKNRFFILDKGTFTYYESSTANPPYGINKKGELLLRDVSVSECKCLVTLSARGKGQQDLILEIKYPNEREEWIAALKEHIAYIKAVSAVLHANLEA